MPFPSDVAFSPAVKAVQAERGSRKAYAKVEQRGWETSITPELAGFLAEQTTAFLATASADGQPYIQHRGGPPGFLHVVDPHTVAWVDYTGNRQYVTAGNLGENPRVCLFVIDYARRQRVKLWGTARVVTDDPALLARLVSADYDARAEQLIVMTVTTWDWNCPQHIPQKVDVEEVAPVIAQLRQRVAELETEVVRLRSG